MELEGILNGDTRNINVEEKDGRYSIKIDGREFTVDFCEPEEAFFSLLIDGESYEISIDENEVGYTVYLYDHTYNIEVYDPMKKLLRMGRDGIASGPRIISAPMPGRIVEVLAEEGRKVKKGEGLVVVEAMKMENELKAPADGKVSQILVSAGDTVESNQQLIKME